MESVKDAAPDYQHRGRKYWWKLFLKDSHDTGQTIGDEVLNDPEQMGFINDLIGQGAAGGAGTGPGIDETMTNVSTYPFDVSGQVDELKKDVLFRPPEVDKDVEDISGDDNFYPDADKFGRW